MDRDVAKEFRQILVRSAQKDAFAKEYGADDFFVALEAAEKELRKNPGNADFALVYRKRIMTIRSLIITALIEALDGLDRKVENLEAINALLENIAHARSIQSKIDIIKVVYLVIDNFNKYEIGICDGGAKI